MQVSLRTEPGFNVLRLEGDVDLQASPAARKQILDSLKSGTHLLVDLSAVNYMDSSGIASLVEGLQAARSQGVQFGLLSVSQSVLQVLKLARLDKVFPLYDASDDFRAVIAS